MSSLSNSEEELQLPSLVSSPSEPPASYVLSARLLLGLPVWIPVRTRGEKQVLKKKGVPWEFMVGTQVYKYAVDIHGAKGLPTTSDMQLFLALEDIVGGVIEAEGQLPTEPLCIRPSVLIQSTNRIDGGKNYHAVGDFFDRMLGLVVYSYVWGGKEKTSVGQSGQRPPRFHIFSSILPPGSTKDDGSVTACWEVQFSQWYGRSLEQGHTMLVDHRGFRRLTRPISMLLHQYLYEALYVGGGGARIAYEDLTRLFVLPQYTAQSRIHQQLDQAHEELKTIGLIKSAHVERIGKQRYELIWEAGRKWYEIGEEMKRRDLLPSPEVTIQGLLPGGVPVEAGNGSYQTAEEVEFLVKELIRFDGHGASYVNFYRKAAQMLSRASIYKVMGDIRERLETGWRPHKSKGAYFVGELKRAAAKQGIVLGRQSRG